MITFESGYDLFNLGRNEDGEQMVGRFYFVTATHEDGRRWRLHTGADTLECAYEEDCSYVWVKTNDLARDTADLIAGDLSEGIANSKTAARAAKSDWVEDVPVYGSASHDEYALYDEDDWAIANRF